jgi:two-component system OmpR family sensor kinase
MARRLILWLTCATVLFWLVAAGVAALVMREEFDEVFDSALKETAERLMPLVVNSVFQRDATDPPSSMDRGNTGEEEYLAYQARDGAGRILLRSHDAQQDPFDAPLERGFHDVPGYRIYTEEAVSGTLFLQVADRLKNRAEAVREGAVSLLVPLIFLVPLNMLIVWLVVRRSLRPVELVRAEIGARDGGNLLPMQIDGLPSELAAIAGSVNRLFERLRKALDAERSFAANSAHELRTPIAGALAQTQRLIAELPEGGAKARASQIEENLSALGSLSEKLLQLARAESGIGLAAEPADIASILDLVLEDFERMPEFAGRLRHEDFSEATPVERNVDVDALGIVLRNLIENALVHGDHSMPVEIDVRDDGTIAITSGGAVVPVDDLQHLGERFRRGRSAAEGSGLGLAISTMLVRQMGGTLGFASPAAGRSNGFEVLLELPRVENV